MAFGGGAGGAPSVSDCFSVAFSLTGVSAALPFERDLRVRLSGSTMTVRVFRLDFLALLIEPSGLRVAVTSEEPGDVGETGTCSVEGRLMESAFPFVIVSFDGVRELFLLWEGVRWMPFVGCSDEVPKSLEMPPILSRDKPFLCRLCFDDVEPVFSEVVGTFSSGGCPGVAGGPVTSMETAGAVVLCAEASRWVTVSERSRYTVADGVLGRAFAELLLGVSTEAFRGERSRSGLDGPEADEPFAMRLLLFCCWGSWPSDSPYSTWMVCRIPSLRLLLGEAVLLTDPGGEAPLTFLNSSTVPFEVMGPSAPGTFGASCDGEGANGSSSTIGVEVGSTMVELKPRRDALGAVEYTEASGEVSYRYSGCACWLYAWSRLLREREGGPTLCVPL